MLDILLLWPAIAALLGVSLLTVSCCGGPPSSRISHNPSSMGVEGGGRGALNIDGETRSRKLEIIAQENVNYDVKRRRSKSTEKTQEDFEKKDMRRKPYREKVSESAVLRSRMMQPGDDSTKTRTRKSNTTDTKDGSEKKDSRGRRKRDNDNKKEAPLPTSTSDKLGKQSGTEKKKEDTVDESATGGSKYIADDSRKGAAKPAPCGTNETMASKERADENDSTKQKRTVEGNTAKTPLVNTLADTQIDSEKPKKPDAPPKPKKKLTKKKEEEVRLWNEAIARGNVFRPRKDDETIDEVNVDWNA